VKFYFSNKTKQKIPRRYFLFVLKKALRNLGVKNDIELSLVLLEEREIRKLNKKHRGRDETTDVLSFPIDLAEPNSIKKFNLSDKIILGDVFLCPSFITKNNKGHKEELGFVFLHGLIHLFGYDHNNKRENKQWQRIIKKAQN